MAPNEVDQLKVKINEVSNQNKELDSKLDSLDKKLDKVIFHVNGDPETETLGIVQKVRHTEINIQALTSKFMDSEQGRKIEKEVRKATVRTWALVAGFGGGLAGWLFKIILGFLLKGVL